ncbi:MAG: Do family serine endopeptidase [Rhodospirillaceae bacterium]|nr:Do family serine endopeptidase [Rhodospirillaceae bacterium]
MTARMLRWFPAAAAGAALAFAVPQVIEKNFVPHLMPQAAAETSMAALQAAGVPSLAPIIDRVTPAVVNVAVKEKASSDDDDNNGGAAQQIPEEFRKFFNLPEGQNGQRPKPRARMASGSGVIIDAKKGYIITNHHVVAHAGEITVTLKDRREFTAKVIGSDEGTDIALLKIDADNLSELPIGDSSAMKVGDFVIAVGNPFGLGQTVTSGIVSAMGRSGLAIEGYEDFIQTDASINPGNSGGALVNMKGQLIGINTAIMGPSGGNVGIGFAVPTSMAESVVAQITKYGEVKRGRIGVQIQDLTPELAKSLGVDQTGGAVIERVEKDTPADRGGIKTGDVVVAIDGTPITGASALRNRVGLSPVGTDLKFTVLRGGSKKDLSLTVEKEAKAVVTAAVNERPTLQGAKFAGDGAVPSKASAGGGVEIVEVERGSPAWQVGLRPKDLVVAVNRTAVKNIQELDEALKTGRQAALFIKRGGEDVLVVV